jgi:pyruvate/2-oxoglutarate dehydrogenase complex dihydrolipoamide acyltransferase (E2) component
LNKWHKSKFLHFHYRSSFTEVGDFVTTDELIAQIGTERAIVEIRAPEPGRITGLLARENQRVQLGAELYLLDSTKPEKQLKPRKKKQPKIEEEDDGPQIELGEEQQKVMDMVLSGKSLFFTGPAGTGI